MKHRQVCTLEGCERRKEGLGYCGPHLARLRRYGDPLAGRAIRSVTPPPPRPLAPQRLCDVEGCGRRHVARGLCKTHWTRRNDGEADWSRPIHVFTGRHVTKNGYVMIQVPLDHPMATSYGKAKRPTTYRRNHAYAMEHRVVMAEHLGRPLLPSENVHHINGRKDDNRLENLELWVRPQPTGQRVQDRVTDALDTLHRYAPHLLADGGTGLPLAV